MGTSGVGKSVQRQAVMQSTAAQQATQALPTEPAKDTAAAAPAEPAAAPPSPEPTATTTSKLEAAVTHARNVTANVLQQSLLGKLGLGTPEVAKTGVGDAVRRAAEQAKAQVEAQQQTPDAPPPPAQDLEAIPFTPNPTAVENAKTAHKGELYEKVIKPGIQKYGHIYREASERTGVPAHLIAALHYNEGKMTSGKGPESGFGLDPRAFKDSQGNAILAKHGLAPWQRGAGTELAVKQSAIIAAECLKMKAEHNGARVGPNMTEQDYNVAIHAYGLGSQKAIDRAKANGKGFMFDPSDDNPHPMHPGGTSIGKDGEVVKVKPGRVSTNLRWDALCPILKEELDKTHPRPTSAPQQPPPPTTPTAAEPATNGTVDKAWGDLNADEKRDWGTLGWNEQNWEGGTPPASSQKAWQDLSTEERTAATRLGYDEKKWDAEEVAAPPPAAPGVPDKVPLQGIPPRPADAMGGKEFAQKLANLPPDKRDQAVLAEIEKGNIPESMRNLEPVTVKRTGPDGKEHEIKMFVMPDYISIGSDGDNVRVPMLPQTAQRIADKMNCSLPTRRMVDDIYGAAPNKVPFKGLQGSDQYRASGKAIGDHERGYADSNPGPGIRAGHKKDIFIPAPDGKVGIYGGFNADGSPVHPKFRQQAHGDFYVDYSHGARMVSNTVYIDGKPVPLDQALRDPALAPMLNDEGVMDRTRYPERNTAYPNL